MHRVRGKNATEGKIQGDRAIQRLEDSISATVQLETGPEIPEQRKRVRRLEDLAVTFSPAVFHDLPCETRQNAPITEPTTQRG